MKFYHHHNVFHFLSFLILGICTLHWKTGFSSSAWEASFLLQVFLFRRSLLQFQVELAHLLLHLPPNLLSSHCWSYQLGPNCLCTWASAILLVSCPCPGFQSIWLDGLFYFPFELLFVFLSNASPLSSLSCPVLDLTPEVKIFAKIYLVFAKACQTRSSR